MKKQILGLLLVLGILFVVGCQPQEGEAEDAFGEGFDEGSEKAALAGEAIVSGPSFDLNNVQYLDLAKNTIIGLGSDYTCSLAASDSCSLVDGKIIRTWTFRGNSKTGTLSDGCQKVGKVQRSNDYGCLGKDAVYCYKTCSGRGCDTSAGICVGDSYPICGNNVIEGSEACDDGNTNSGDGCSSTCQVEDSWTCSGAPSTCIENLPVPVVSFCLKGKEVCAGETALFSAGCQDPAGATNCCMLQDAVGSCDERFQVNTTTVNCAGINETRIVRKDCSEAPLVSELGTGVNTCVMLGSAVQRPACAPCGGTICQVNSNGYQYVKTSGTPGTCSSTETFVRMVDDGVCDDELTLTCTDTDGKNVTNAGSVTVTLSDGRSNTLADSCTSPNGGKEYYCGTGSILQGESFNCPVAERKNCLAGMCVIPTSCTDDGLVNSKSVKNNVTLVVDGVGHLVEDRCLPWGAVYEVSCGTGSSANTYKETYSSCGTGLVCRDGVCSSS